jgi:SAM-dependent methyltransferase
MIECANIGALDLREWARPIDHAERSLLNGIVGPVLEIGCGPGRFIAALAERGTPALGIDDSPLATQLAAQRGAPILARSVFDRVPGEGRWPTVLVLDGSIGIGGNPIVLLRRIGQLLRPRGLALIEVLGPGVSMIRGEIGIEHEAGQFTSIPWAELGVDDLMAVAHGAGFTLERARRIDRRWFAWLRVEPAP